MIILDDIESKKDQELIMEFLELGSKTNAIRQVRRVTGRNLKDSKAFVDSLNITPTCEIKEEEVRVYKFSRRQWRDINHLVQNRSQYKAILMIRKISGLSAKNCRNIYDDWKVDPEYTYKDHTVWIAPELREPPSKGQWWERVLDWIYDA